MAIVFKIHPTIGFARVGSSQEHFVGPELVGKFASPPDGKYRDGTGELKRQGARFRVFAHDDANPAGEPKQMIVGQDGLARIEWRVHLKNEKASWFKFAGVIGEGPVGYPPGHPLRNPGITSAQARAKLAINPLERSILADGTAKRIEISKGTSPTPAEETWPAPFTGGKVITSLGTLITQPEGWLTVAGGFGISGTPGPFPPNGSLQFDNNDNWFDDISDGPVTAKLIFANGSEATVVPSWVVVAPPDYAPPIENIVTAYDLMYDLALRTMKFDTAIFNTGSGFQAAFRPSFTKHIYPILKRSVDYKFVIRQASGHGPVRFNISLLAKPPAPGETPATNPRLRIFERLRNPDNLADPDHPERSMPRLHNDGVDGQAAEQFMLTVTRFQYFAMSQWAAGTFVADWPGSPPAPASVITASGLDRAALEAACGGGFFPGMEVAWILRDPRVYTKPFEFRFTHLANEGPTGLTAGDATKRMALPWQADFLKCGDNWWPAQRPDQVKTSQGFQEWRRPLNSVSGHVRLVSIWSKLGIVVPDPNAAGEFIESERETIPPGTITPIS